MTYQPMASHIHPSKTGTGRLRSRVLRAGSWTFLGYGLAQVLRLGSNLVLTRLLVPEMFGVMALVSVVFIGLNMLSDVGLRANVVQSTRGEEQKYLNTAWVVQIIRSVLLFAIALLLSGLFFIAGNNDWIPETSAYADPMLPLVLSVMSITLLISGFGSTKLFVANRKLYIGRIVTLDLISQIAGIIVTIGIALVKPTIWAIVIGGIVQTTIKMLLSHTAIPGPSNYFQWDHEAFKEILHFGKWIFLASVLGFLVNQGDRLMLGGFISAEVLGVYSIAFFLSSSIKSMFNQVFVTTLFPALSEVSRERIHELSRVYYKARSRIDIVTMFMAGLLFVTGDLIIEILYDDRYIEAGWMMEILSLSIAGIGFYLANECAVALGHTRFFSGIVAIKALTLYVSLPVLIHFFGLPGAIWAIALYPITGIIASTWYMKKNGLLQLHKEFMMVPFAIVGGLVGALAEFVTREYLF